MPMFEDNQGSSLADCNFYEVHGDFNLNPVDGRSASPDPVLYRAWRDLVAATMSTPEYYAAPDGYAAYAAPNGYAALDGYATFDYGRWQPPTHRPSYFPPMAPYLPDPPAARHSPSYPHDHYHSANGARYYSDPPYPSSAPAKPQYPAGGPTFHSSPYRSPTPSSRYSTEGFSRSRERSPPPPFERNVEDSQTQRRREATRRQRIESEQRRRDELRESYRMLAKGDSHLGESARGQYGRGWEGGDERTGDGSKKYGNVRSMRAPSGGTPPYGQRRGKAYVRDRDRGRAPYGRNRMELGEPRMEYGERGTGREYRGMRDSESGWIGRKDQFACSHRPYRRA
ncbi:hypothetical protein DFH09DRAFT_1150853 [Mycena vulgaris]|nr:hypothetical protein DFH09DRAFT_1150853 [Mycena vulgaris]